MPDRTSSPKETQIPTNLRLLLILEEVVRRGVAVKPAQLADALGLPKPTLHRLLQTAEEEAFLQRDLDGRSYGPGPRLRSLAVNTISSEHLRTARLAILKAVAEEIGETCNLATPDREGMTYLDRVETKWPLRIQLPIGTQVPFHCTASGKMYLSTLRAATLNSVLSARALEPQTDKTITSPDALRAELQKTRERGYSTDDEEFMTGMAAIAVPILDTQDRLMATLSVHAPVQRHSLSQILEFLEPLKTAAMRLTQLHEDLSTGN
ncbi:putative transcriptional regulator, IclR family [Phaeobacter piscinae]|uniref:Transcriptional regulator, IclR family n=1 Tax=Phaeobacter piscinae TaxID=1580596 RepID=A0ABM6PF18_9RHOB|nr:IclR family transcriptional regulator [Phaeobacter piscinae]ATG36312.1 putative transcriptional regulator, IclR family [Phaeobacter piscinae]AUQ86833.1 putative transcriptional regulator, IclR family [Phaeobacter piscinae]AUR24716.1 putative transcriptional regulator, IclR family [Phaeobacter piscinae]